MKQSKLIIGLGLIISPCIYTDTHTHKKMAIAWRSRTQSQSAGGGALRRFSFSHDAIFPLLSMMQIARRQTKLAGRNKVSLWPPSDAAKSRSGILWRLLYVCQWLPVLMLEKKPNSKEKTEVHESHISFFFKRARVSWCMCEHIWW